MHLGTARRLSLGVALVTGLVLAAGAAAAEVVRVETLAGPRVPPERYLVVDTVRGLDRDGVVVWSHRHDQTYHDLVGPLTVAGRTVYASRADLLELDAQRGRIVGRYRFPAEIVALAPDPSAGPGEPRLRVSLRVEPENRASMPTTSVVMAYRLGDPPAGRSAWGFASSDWISFLPDDLKLPSEAREAEAAEPSAAAKLARLDDRIALDLTDVGARVERGRWLALLGRDAEARAAYSEAAALPAAPWQDLLRTAGILEYVGARDAARTAFDRGMRGMRAAHVRPEREQGLITMMVLGGNPLIRAIAAAVRAEDVDRVDELEARMWQISPLMEAGNLGWPVLADWFAAQGKRDLAARWRARGERAADAWFNVSRARVLCSIELMGPVLGGMLIAVMIATLLLGIRSGQARMAQRAARGARGGPRWWPRFRWHDALLIGLPLAAAIGAALHIRSATNAWVTGMWSAAESDSLATPEMSATLAKLPASAARDEVLAYARAENAAALAGTWYDGPMPSEANLVDAFADGPGVAGSRLADADQSLDWSFGSTHAVIALRQIDNPLPFVAILLGALTLGFVLATRWPRVGRWTADLVPGGASSFSAASGLVIGGFAAAVLALTVGVTSFGTFQFASYFGLAEVWHEPATSHPWAWVALVGIAALQAALVIRARRQPASRQS